MASKFISGFVNPTRFDAWVVGWAAIKDSPIFGHGLGNWKVLFKNVPGYAGEWTTAHCEPIQGVGEMGFGIIVLTALYFRDVFLRYVPVAILPTTALVVITANAGVHFIFHIGTTALISLAWMAILQIQINETKGVILWR